MKTNLSQILPYYLGTGLKVQRPDRKTVLEMVGMQLDTIIFKDYSFGDANSNLNKPLLRSLSKLTEPITVDVYNDGKPFVPIDYPAFKLSREHLIELQNNFAHYKSVKFGIIERLLSWHFNVFNLQPDQFVEIEEVENG